jgi:hypothetical protein
VIEKILDDVYSHVSGVVKPLFHEYAPQGNKYPYCVFHISSGSVNGKREDYILTFNVWGDSSCLDSLDSMVKNLDSLLVDYVCQGEFFNFRVSKLSMMEIPDFEPIRRREVRYLVKLYSVKEV